MFRPLLDHLQALCENRSKNSSDYWLTCCIYMTVYTFIVQQLLSSWLLWNCLI